MKSETTNKLPLEDSKEKYYQPEIDINGNMVGHEYDTIWSFQVWHSKDNLLKQFPNCNPIEYFGDDIEEPTFMDERPDSKEGLHTEGEWYVNNATDDNGNIIIKTNPAFDNQKYFTLAIKGTFNVVGFYYPSSKQSDTEMIANAKLICKAVNERKALLDSQNELENFLNDLLREKSKTDEEFDAAQGLFWKDKIRHLIGM